MGGAPLSLSSLTSPVFRRLTFLPASASAPTRLPHPKPATARRPALPRPLLSSPPTPPSPSPTPRPSRRFFDATREASSAARTKSGVSLSIPPAPALPPRRPKMVWPSPFFEEKFELDPFQARRRRHAHARGWASGCAERFAPPSRRRAGGPHRDSATQPIMAHSISSQLLSVFAPFRARTSVRVVSSFD